MRGYLLAWLLTCLLLFAVCAPVVAQDPKKDAPPTKYEREGGSMFIPYTLALVGTIIVMILVCMPVRRD